MYRTVTLCLQGMTALHWACFHNRPKHAQLLLLKGVNPFVHDIDGRNALHWAAQVTSQMKATGKLVTISAVCFNIELHVVTR